MTDQTPPTSDDGLRPPASLTAVPVRRRRKDATIPAPAKPRVNPPSTNAPEQAIVAAKPRKETFGKLRQADTEQPASPVAVTPDEQKLDSAPTAAPSPVNEQPAAALPPEDIIALWESLAGEGSIPALIDLDLGRVAAHWPNSMLLRASGNPRRPNVEVARIFSADPAHNTAPLRIDTMVIDWMMALAREVIHDGVPVHELDPVSADEPGVEYGVIALPFGDSVNAVDHVLCHLYRYAGSPGEATPDHESKNRAPAAKSGRKMMASIFGRRQNAAG